MLNNAGDSLFHKFSEYLKTYPKILGKSELCAYYRRRNKEFPLCYSIIMFGVISNEAIHLAEYLLPNRKLIHMLFEFILILEVDIPLLIPLWYGLSIIPEVKSQKRKEDLKYQSKVRTNTMLFTIIPTLVLSSMPLLFPQSSQNANIVAASWIFNYVILLHICMWGVDGIFLKELNMAILNIIYCLLAVYKGFFDSINITIFVTPLTMSFVFLVVFDRYEKENFLLKRRINQQKFMYEKHLENFEDPIIILDKFKVHFSNKACTQKFTNEFHSFMQKMSHAINSQGEPLNENLNKRLNSQDLSSQPLIQRKYNMIDENTDKIQLVKIYNVSIHESLDLHGNKIISVALHDLTEESKREQEQAESKFKNILFFSLSHELRTPLNIFQAFLQVSKSAVTTSEQRDLREKSKGAWRYLRNKINDILDYVKILSEEFTLYKSIFSLRKFVRKMKRLTHSLMEKRQRATISLDFDVEKNVFDLFEGDPDRIEQVLFNFLSNAVKHTTSGTIRLRVYLFPERANKYAQAVNFEVEDTGCGISSEVIQSLFKCESSNSIDIEGKAKKLCGLGLTVSKMICQNMDTNIEVCSEQGKGSKFSFCLINTKGINSSEEFLLANDQMVPDETFNLAANRMNESVSERIRNCNTRIMNLKHDIDFRSSRKYGGIGKMRFTSQKCEYKPEGDNYVLEDTENPLIQSKKLSKLIVLVVDDAELNRYVLKNMLKRENITIFEAEDGKHALFQLDKIYEDFENYEPNLDNLKVLIFMDINMPNMDGIESTTEIRRRKLHPEPYIVALTAFSSESERLKCIKCGMNAFISKPITKERVDDLLTRMN